MNLETNEILIQEFMVQVTEKLFMTSTFKEAIQCMKKTRLEIIPVVHENNGSLVGAMTKSNLFTALLNNASLSQTIECFLTKRVIKARDDINVGDLRDILTYNKKHHAIIVDGEDKPIGIFSKDSHIQGLFWEKRLFKQESQLLANSIDMPVALINLYGKITLANQYFNKMFLTPPLSQISDTIDEILKIPVLTNNLNSFIYRGTKFWVERTPIIGDNQHIGYLLSFKPQRISVMSNNTDIVDSNQNIENSFFTIRINDIIGSSSPMKKVQHFAKIFAPLPATILLLGESGTGKELFARAIHNESGKDGPFIAINCAAIPENLLEGELFGYAEGAFTGAQKGGKIGLFELAQRGTLFLDEIGDMPLVLQAKILRVLQEHKFRLLGDTKEISIDLRFIAATNKDLAQSVKNGTFREDLFYRLDVFSLELPPLRERKADLKELINHFIQKYNLLFKKDIKDINEAAFSLVSQYDWPGNIRQLENVIQRAVALEVRKFITPEVLPNFLRKDIIQNTHFALPSEAHEYKNKLGDIESTIIQDVLEKTNFNRTEAAKLLGISRSTLYKKISKYDISL